MMFRLVRDPDTGRSRFETPTGSRVVSLDAAPEKLEPQLESGTWLVVVAAVWSGSDMQMLAIVPTLAERLDREIQVAMRPFNDPHEFETWCSMRYRAGSPLWILFRNGEASLLHEGWWNVEAALACFQDARDEDGAPRRKLRLPFGLPWTRALTIGVVWNSVVLALAALYCVAMQFWLFDALGNRYSVYGAALPLNVIAAYQLMWPSLAVLLAASVAVFAIQDVFYRDGALLMVALAGTIAVGNGLYAIGPIWYYMFVVVP